MKQFEIESEGARSESKSPNKKRIKTGGARGRKGRKQGNSNPDGASGGRRTKPSPLENKGSLAGLVVRKGVWAGKGRQLAAPGQCGNNVERH